MAYWLKRQTLEREVGGSILTLGAFLCPWARHVYSKKIQVIPRRRWLRPDRTEKLFTRTLSKNETKQNLTSWHLNDIIRPFEQLAPEVLQRDKCKNNNVFWGLFYYYFVLSSLLQREVCFFCCLHTAWRSCIWKLYTVCLS